MRLLYNLYKLKRQMEFSDPVKLNLKDKTRLKGSKKEQKQGFAYAKYMQASFIKDIEDIFNSEKENGLTYPELQKVLVDKLSNRGWLPKDSQVPTRVDLIIKNTIAVSQAKARFEKQIATKDYYPYLKWRQQERTNKRHDHEILNGKIFSKDDPDLVNIYPPRGFRCNCIMENINQKEFDKNKYEITPVNDAVKDLDSSSKDYGGFNWKPNLKDFPKEIQKKLDDSFKNDPIQVNSNIDSDFEELSNRVVFCSEDEFKASWDNNVNEARKFFNGKLITKQTLIDLFVPKIWQDDKTNNRFKIDENSNGFRLKYINSKVDITRNFYTDPNDNYVSHSYYEVDKALQGNGDLRPIFLNQLALYRELGYKKITIHANIDVGNWAWIRYNFKCTTLSNFYSRLNYQFINSSFLTNKHIKYIADSIGNNQTPTLQEFVSGWEQNGFDVVQLKMLIINYRIDWWGEIDLTNLKELQTSIDYAK